MCLFYLSHSTQIRYSRFVPGRVLIHYVAVWPRGTYNIFYGRGWAFSLFMSDNWDCKNVATAIMLVNLLSIELEKQSYFNIYTYFLSSFLLPRLFLIASSVIIKEIKCFNITNMLVHYRFGVICGN